MENGDCETFSSRDTARPWQSYHTVYTNAKAGMDGVDKEKVQRVVYEMSKGSKYFDNEERKEAFMRQKIENMRSQCAKLTTAYISHYQMIADKRILELEVTRDLSRIWLHVDMDAFYAAAETISNPSIKGKPMAVGSMSMICTANYEARRFGVRAAMPGFIARKLCPELIFVRIDFKKYTYYSDLTRKVFHKYDPNFIAASLDEAYLDITEICKERGMTGEEVAEELRTRVYDDTGLTCSAGVAPNRLLAKVCSDINKPNGQFVLPNDRMAVMTFISSLPIRKIGGIGKVTEHILRDVFGINTCEELLKKSGPLCALFSRISADFFLCVGLGIGRTDAPQVKLRKSISSERTFSATDDEALLYQKLVELAEMLSTDMRKEGLCGRTLTLKMKTSSFEVQTRAVTLQKYIWSTEDILNHASKLLKAEFPVSLRLIGLRMSHFNEDGVTSDPTQKTLTSYIISEDAHGKTIGGHSSLGLEADDHHFMIDKEADLPVDSHERWHYKSKDLLDTNHMFDLDNNYCTSSNSAGEMEHSHQPLSNKIVDEVNTPDMVDCTLRSYKAEAPQVAEAESSSFMQSEGNSLDRISKRTSHLDDEADCATVSWVDDYKCSLCGTELPPSFVEERQEHSDFHLAERLQKEESRTNSGSLMPRQRFIQKERSANQSKSKKHKSSPKEGDHIPIDLFFIKSNRKF